jgi:hypothetical protein
VLGHRKDQGALERPPRLAILADDLVDQLQRGGVSMALGGRDHHQSQGRAVGHLPALVWERYPFQSRGPRLERLLNHVLDSLVDVLGRDSRAAVG